ncbi:hypothetical protein XM38_034700 [Halomicronema hongdechloris C2206]|uniref:DUF29 domain-containing protein n=1 Tax=Halomicronema hongdechloris C2206 TaxID=1641165 RepID=A0A1V8NDV0_9CYAN|nr:DUF29 domain-containing protein [Halomicronema hongdechloris]ASC72512.1 hypothetical protein XM38_034700 [Halomicronema hongdechloris C2206]
MTAPLQQPSGLYDQDYVLWLEATVDLLRQGKLEQIDIPSLIEELEDMGRSEKRALESNLEVLLRHLLKYQYQPERRSNSWRFTILEQRDRIERLFRDSPSLKPYYESVFADCYARARRKAAVETGLSIEVFPENAPFTPAETLNPDFLPAI